MTDILNRYTEVIQQICSTTSETTRHSMANYGSVE